MNKKTKIYLGNEYDDRLREKLKATLRALGAIQTDKNWGIGGSQELETLTVLIQGEEIVVESETYMGISLIGNEDLVRDIALRVMRTMPKGF